MGFNKSRALKCTHVQVPTRIRKHFSTVETSPHSRSPPAFRDGWQGEGPDGPFDANDDFVSSAEVWFSSRNFWTSNPTLFTARVWTFRKGKN